MDRAAHKAIKISLSAKISLLILVMLYSIMLLSDFIAPYDPLYQNPEAGYASPTKIHLDKNGFYIYPQKFLINELTYQKQNIEVSDGKKYYLKFFQDGKVFSVERPAHIYLLGTDRIGRDLFSRLVHGSKPSLLIGFLGILIAFPIGAIYGGISGYLGGPVDNIMMRLAEAIMSLPTFYLLIILSAMLPASLDNFQRFALITVILSFVSWAGLARIIRGQVLSIKSKEFIDSAKTIGQKDHAIVLKHLIPHTFSFLVIAMTLSVPGFIIGESALSFLGLGINQPDPSWGNILAEGKDLSNILTRPWLIFIPTALIFAAVFSFNILGDYLRDLLDPKAQ